MHVKPLESSNSIELENEEKSSNSIELENEGKICIRDTKLILYWRMRMFLILGLFYPQIYCPR